MLEWLVGTLRTYPQIAVFLALAIGFVIGPIRVFGFNLGNVTATLLAGVVIGQFHIVVAPDVKNTLFILFLFAVGFGVGPQFVRGLSSDGPKQIAFSLIVLALCLLVPWACAVISGLPLGFSAGLYAGSQTISAAIGVATDQINQLGLPPEQAKTYADQIPIAYAVTYIWGTIGSAIILAQLGPKLIGVDLPAACREYEAKLGGGAASSEPGIASGYQRFAFRAYLIDEASGLAGRPVRELLPGLRVFVERVRRNGQIIAADGDTVLQVGDVAAFSGPRPLLVEHLETILTEVEDRELLSGEAEVVDIYVTQKAFAGRTLRELDREPWSRGVYVRKIVRSMVELPILPDMKIERGDIITVVGSRRHVEAAIKALGFPDRPVETTDIAYVSWGIVLGGFVGALTIVIGGIPIGLSTSGGALLAGLIFGWLRTTHPVFGRVPGPALWLMNTLGLNIFIAVVGISAGPGFVAGLQQVGISLFLWGVVATSVPMVASVYIGHYLFRFHPAILFGACAGVRTTTAALGMVQEAAKSRIPALGYGMPYAVGNTLLTIFGLVIVLLLAP
ncbi:aspartate-alanine antiporter [Roseococcus sp. YIM B11640]|uniref:aspartate-alanine antiporter n=1 Tax=Roseococcus sp. YIM B11640 TaxID=3133973 RepID=UPI003C7A8B3B